MHSKCSWMIIVCFLIAWMSMQYHSSSNPIEGLAVSLPLIGLVVFLSEIKRSLSMQQTTVSDQFSQTFLTISLNFFLGGLLHVVANYDNTDLRGWWPFVLYGFFIYGLIFSLVYTLIAWAFSFYNTKYNYCFSFLIILFFILDRFIPFSATIYLLGDVDIFYLVLACFFILHVLTLFVLKLSEKTFFKRI